MSEGKRARGGETPPKKEGKSLPLFRARRDYQEGKEEGGDTICAQKRKGEKKGECSNDWIGDS